MIAMPRRAAMAGSVLLPFLKGAPAFAADPVRIGQATPALAFLPLWAARAYDTFQQTGLSLAWAAIPGGDPATLAALDAGDIDLAAVGSDTALAAMSKGLPFVMVASLMSKMSLEVVVSAALLKRTGVSAQDTLAKRIGALQGAVFGVSAIGGTQERTARWIAARGGLDPKAGIQVVSAGAPPAIQAALENARIDAFVLSPPEPGLAEAGGYGVRLIDPSADFPELKGLPNLVLVARRDPDAASASRTGAAVAAISLGAAAVVADPDGAANRIGSRFFAKVPQPVMRAAIRSMLDGLDGSGRFLPSGIAALAAFSKGSGTPMPSGEYWTNQFFT